MSEPAKLCSVYVLPGLTNYRLAWKYMKTLSEHAGRCRKAGNPISDSLLLVEHPSIYTLGKAASEENVKFPYSLSKDTSEKDEFVYPHDILRVERGGEVTWHGPGQLVAYPIVDLNNHKRDLHW